MLDTAIHVIAEPVNNIPVRPPAFFLQGQRKVPVIEGDPGFDAQLEKKIDHDFITRPGGHTGQYWNNSIDYQILFFDKFFKK